MDKMRKVTLWSRGALIDEPIILELPASEVDDTGVISLNGVLYRFDFTASSSGDAVFTEVRALKLGAKQFPFSKLDKRPRITLTAAGDRGVGKSLVLRDVDCTLRALGFETRLNENDHRLEIIAEDVASKCGGVGG